MFTQCAIAAGIALSIMLLVMPKFLPYLKKLKRNTMMLFVFLSSEDQTLESLL